MGIKIGVCGVDECATPQNHAGFPCCGVVLRDRVTGDVELAFNGLKRVWMTRESHEGGNGEGCYITTMMNTKRKMSLIIITVLMKLTINDEQFIDYSDDNGDWRRSAQNNKNRS